MDRRSLAVVALVAVGVAGTCLSAGVTDARRFTVGVEPTVPQGSFDVQALAGGFWQRVGSLPCDRFVREYDLALPAAALAAPRVRVRLAARGGGAAHIDRVLLGEEPPAEVSGAAEPDAKALLARLDDDLVDAAGRTIELTFAAHRGGVLRLAARIEGKVVEGSPFAFPPDNTFGTVTPASAFYRYRPSASGAAPAWPRLLDASRALFAERCRPTTGHPDGTTYGWVANDASTLYAAVEFTPDNTCDGDKDFSSVTVMRNGELREFRVSEAETRWGRPSFVSTARAAYRHKLYTFAIPFSALGAASAADAGELKLAFAAYGTSAVTWVQPGFWNFGPIDLGATSPSHDFVVTNNTAVVMTLGTPWFTRAGDSGLFAVDPGTCSDGLVLQPNGACTFHMTFAPVAVGSFSAITAVSAQFGTAPPVIGSVLAQGQGILAIPAYGTWGLVLMAAALLAAGVFLLRRW